MQEKIIKYHGPGKAEKKGGKVVKKEEKQEEIKENEDIEEETDATNENEEVNENEEQTGVE